MADKLTLFSNGREAVDHFSKLLEEHKRLGAEGKQVPLQPVTLLLLDVNVPIMDGMEVLRRTKQLFEECNQTYAD